MGKIAILVGLGLVLVARVWGAEAGQRKEPNQVSEKQANWRLGTQAYSFRAGTFFEAVDKTKSLGLKYIESYPRQQMRKGSDVQMGPALPAAARLEAKKYLAAAGVKLVNFGVVELDKDEAKSRQVFDFAKDMGIETIVSEPAEEAIATVDKLAQEYQIKVAIHNHPQPSHYWSPDTVLAALNGRSPWLGACADTGHWMRSGINPLDGLKKLEGRIISLHLKDLNASDPKGYDVVWGTGKADMEGLLTELVRQKFKGVFAIEWEHNTENFVQDIAGCVKYFNAQAAKLKQDEK